MIFTFQYVPSELSFIPILYKSFSNARLRLNPYFIVWSRERCHWRIQNAGGNRTGTNNLWRITYGVPFNFFPFRARSHFQIARLIRISSNRAGCIGRVVSRMVPRSHDSPVENRLLRQNPAGSRGRPNRRGKRFVHTLNTKHTILLPTEDPIR